MSHKFYSIVLLGNLWLAVHRANNREELRGWGLLPDDLCTKTGRPFAEVLRKKHPDTLVTPVEISRAPYLSAMRIYLKRHPSNSRRVM